MNVRKCLFRVYNDNGMSNGVRLSTNCIIFKFVSSHRTDFQYKHLQLTQLCIFFNLVCEAIGTAATPGLLCQPRVIVKMIAEKQMECRLAGETEVLGENLPQCHFCPS
jgi:hypothetical protein